MTTSTLANPAELKATFFKWMGASHVYPSAKAAHDSYAPKLVAAITRLAECETPDGVAAFLESQGIKGTIGHSTKCPLAVWLQREVGHDNVRVGGATISIPHEGATTKVDIPAVLFAFMLDFDGGFYPNLRHPDRSGRVPTPVRAAA